MFGRMYMRYEPDGKALARLALAIQKAINDLYKGQGKLIGSVSTLTDTVIVLAKTQTSLVERITTLEVILFERSEVVDDG